MTASTAITFIPLHRAPAFFTIERPNGMQVIKVVKSAQLARVRARCHVVSHDEAGRLQAVM